RITYSADIVASASSSNTQCPSGRCLAASADAAASIARSRFDSASLTCACCVTFSAAGVAGTGCKGERISVYSPMKCSAAVLRDLMLGGTPVHASLPRARRPVHILPERVPGECEVGSCDRRQRDPPPGRDAVETQRRLESYDHQRPRERFAQLVAAARV